MSLMIGATREGGIKWYGVSDMLGVEQPCVVIPVETIDLMSDEEIADAAREMVDVAWRARACVAAEWFLHDSGYSYKLVQRRIVALAEEHADDVLLMERFADEEEDIKRALDKIEECRRSVAERTRHKSTTKSTRRDIQIRYERFFVKVGRRDGFSCIKCGHAGNDLQLDHIKPVSKGGTNELTNLQLLCPSCNFEKSDKVDGEE